MTVKITRRSAAFGGMGVLAGCLASASSRHVEPFEDGSDQFILLPHLTFEEVRV